MAYIQMKHSYKRYKTGDLEIIANNDVSFDIEKGELVVILGASGAGKSTVLNILVGFVFQFYNLVSNLTARENVELASEIGPNAKDATQTLVEVGLGGRLDNFPSQLSGGEQQRVAIARAVAKNPKILLCDEPTGALDYQTGKQILTLLQEMARKQGTTVIIVTHNASLAPIADRVIRMHDAKIKSVELNPNPQKIEDLEY